LFFFFERVFTVFAGKIGISDLSILLFSTVKFCFTVNALFDVVCFSKSLFLILI
jgi:hypothetical protein